MHQGHEIVKCVCGKVIRQCRCMDQFKSTVTKGPCECESSVCGCAKCDAQVPDGEKLCAMCDRHGCRI